LVASAQGLTDTLTLHHVGIAPTQLDYPSIARGLAELDALVAFLDHPSVNVGIEIGAALGYGLRVALAYTRKARWIARSGLGKQHVERVGAARTLIELAGAPLGGEHWLVDIPLPTAPTAPLERVLLPPGHAGEDLRHRFSEAALVRPAEPTLASLVNAVRGCRTLAWVVPVEGKGGDSERKKRDATHMHLAVAAGFAQARGAKVVVLRHKDAPPIAGLGTELEYTGPTDLGRALAEAGFATVMRS
jgi:hypothetical protein